MPKPKIPEYLPVSPISLVCSLCHAKPGKACATSSGGALEIVHIARIQAAAKMDVAANKARETLKMAIVQKRKTRRNS